MSMTEEVDKLNPVVEAKKLKQEFEELLVVILESLVGVDLHNLKFRITWFFNAAGINTPEIQAILDELQSIPTPQIVLNFLISRNIIGYLNYQLIKAFQKAVKNDEVKAKIEKYENKHDAFLYHFSFNAIIEAFKSNPDLAPVSTIGLPKFTVQLKDPWEGKRVYQWKEVLDRMFTWSPHLIVVSLEKKCIVLSYAVLPFFISSVVEDLENPSIIKQLEIEGVSVKLSSDLLKSEKWDHKWHAMKELEVEELGGKKEIPSTRGESNTSHEEQDIIHNSGNSVDLPLSIKDFGHITSCTPVCHPQSPHGGYDENIFVITPPDSLKCPVCLLVVRDPHLLSCCGALICEICIQRNIKQMCPRCRSYGFSKFLDKRTRGELFGQTVRCVNHECKWKGELLDLERHVSGECLYAPKLCQYGCGKYYYRYILPVHEQDECPNRPLHVIIESSQTNKKKLTELEVKYQEQEVLLSDCKTEVDTLKKNMQELKEKYKMEIREKEEQQQKMSEMEQELSVLQDIKQQKESQEMVTTDEDERKELCLNTNDVAVQFDYWVPMEDLLHGAHVVDEIVFNVHSDREQTYEWNECGFRLHVPKEALSPTEVCPVAIKALLGGRFILPENTELVSALYAISQSRKFQKPVKAELQHCVFLENEAQTKRLHFIKAYQTQPGTPYLFEFAEGGEFPLEKRYGSLWHSEFCIFGIVRENGPGPVSEETNGSHDSTDEDDDVESTNGDETPEDETKSLHDSTDDEASEEVVNTKSTTVGQTPDVSKSQSHKEKEESHVTKRDIPDKTVQYHTETPPPLNTAKSDAANTVYRAHTFYEKVSRNRWIFKFVAVKHLKVHIKYVVDSFSSLEKAEAFKFRFKEIPDSSDHSIVLKFTDEENRKLDKWHVRPYSLPCEISREDIDLLDTHELHVPLQGQPETPDIPMCMISLYVDDNTAAPLCYGVPVDGINEEKTIFIMRHAETLQGAQVTTETSQDIHHEQTTPKTPTTPDLKIDCKKLKEEIQRIFNEHFAALNQLLKNIIQAFADELFSVHLISDHVKSSPSYDAISNEVMSAMNFQRNPSKLVSHSVLFLKTMSKLGPPQQFAATSIADELTECINENLKVQLAFTW